MDTQLYPVQWCVEVPVLLQRARALGAEYLATGHYAQITDDNCLQMAIDQNKDQSYHSLSVQGSREDFILIGGMTKVK